MSHFLTHTGRLSVEFIMNDIHVGFIYESYMYVPVPLCEHIIGLGFGVYWVWDY